MIMENNLWAVLIEWDGTQPSSKFYRRLHALAYKVRGDKEQSPLTRRSGDGDGSQGTIFQEGCIICPAQSTARAIAFLAREMLDEMENIKGTPTVSICRLAMTSNFTMTRQDEQVMERIENVMSKRGRKPPATWWAVSCTECGKATDIEHWSPVNCPNCGGFLIHIRRGHTVRYCDPGGDVFDAWVRTRFAGPHWEPAPWSADGLAAPPLTAVNLAGREETAATRLQSSPVMDKIRQMPRETAVAFLDAILINRAHRDTEARMNGRITAATEFFRRNGNPTAVSLAERDEPDLLDATNVLGAEVVAAWLLVA
jgi:predicted RNA-binding Zn-ribbon protein involved in translation (DUF1610 family)